ncbi:formate dehydrogenase, alpha subunit domain protein, partial [Vibrio parahaemolyticus V-223/04]
AYPKTF